MDEKGVQDLANCFLEFECNPFDSTHTVETALPSGEVAIIKLEEGFATAHTQSEKLVVDFLRNGYFQAINNLMHFTMHRSSRGGGKGRASQINQRQRKIPI